MTEISKKYTIDNAKNDIQNLQDQNRYDFQEIKRLDTLIKEYDKRISQAINFNNQINEKIQNDYEEFKKNIIDNNLVGNGGGGGTGLTSEQAQQLQTAYEHSQSTHVQASDIPTKVSDLENDSNFITSIPEEYVTETELSAKGYLTSHQDISGLQTKTDNSLTTTSKEIVGAINELKLNLDGIETGGTNSLSLSISEQTLSLKNGGTSLSSVEIPTATVTDEQVETVITNKINDGSLSLDFEDDLTAYQDLQLKEINIISSSDFVDGYLDINNNVGSYRDFMYTKKYIPVIDGGTYRFGTSGSSGNAGLCYYDENKNFISAVKVATIDNKDVTLPAGTRYIRINISGSKLSDYTINLINSPFRNEISTIKNSVDIIANDPSKNLLLPSSNEIIYDLKNDNPKYKGAGAGTFVSITDFFAEKVFVKSIKINMNASTQEVYLIERAANSGTVNFTIKEKICDLTAITDGELVEYVFENPLPLKNTEFLAIKNTGKLYLQTTEVQGNYYYITGKYNLGDTFSYNATNFGMFRFVGEIIYLETTIGNIDNEFGNIKNNVENNTINIGNLSSKLDNAYDEIKNMRKYPYISVFFDNFNSENSDWINTDSAWTFDYISRTLTSTDLTGNVNTKSNCIVLNRQYHADKRYASIKIKFSSDSILDIGFKNIDTNHADGNGKVRIDIANSKLEIYNGFNTVAATTNFDSFSIDTNKYYIIELERNGLVASLTIYDYITKESVSVSYKFANGFFFDELYVIGKVSGGNVVIKEFNVNIMLNPLVYIIGDSITALASAEKGWANMLANDINGNVVISARGNDSAISIPRKFETEVKHIKPNYLLWCHGHNGEGITESRLDEVQSLCDQYGIKLLVNHVTCMAGDAHIARNEIIECKGYRGARFDIATAVDNNPYKVDGFTADRANSILYMDKHTHPNDLGNMEMYKRLSIDLPELFGR